MRYRISRHASREMERRSISGAIVDEVLDAPQQIVAERDALIACQSQVRFEDGRLFLVRVIVNPQFDPAVVVTVYRTSKVEKYWRVP
ncbi:MAG: DUF4258 domain-containing protein [Magnetococcales bacterium]|nr:DUF4258 domain-containing protein [Magnetococcales bacterium]MBF0157637.1 DUF4258 domain-containing protein [Magnetococcales bacterium]